MQRYPGSIRTHEVPGTCTAGFLPYRCFLAVKLDKKGKLRLIAVLIPLRIVGQNSKRLEIKQNIWRGQTIILV